MFLCRWHSCGNSKIRFPCQTYFLFHFLKSSLTIFLLRSKCKDYIPLVFVTMATQSSCSFTRRLNKDTDYYFCTKSKLIPPILKFLQGKELTSRILVNQVIYLRSREDISRPRVIYLCKTCIKFGVATRLKYLLIFNRWKIQCLRRRKKNKCILSFKNHPYVKTNAIQSSIISFLWQRKISS